MLAIDARLKLSEASTKLANELNKSFEKVRESFKVDGKADDEEFKKMVSLAVQLHKSLVSEKINPIHHKYMIKNRGVKPSDPEFYNHFHPVEDLLRFLKDIESNKDPEDVTIGEEFTFEVFTRRWGHSDFYRLKRTKKGWHVAHIGISGDCDKEGNPYLYKNFVQDSVSYPHNVSDYISSIWERAEKDGLSKSEVQKLLNKVSEWVQTCEKNAPKEILI